MAEQKNNREQQLREYTERLEQGIKDIFESGKYADYLTTLSRFHSYSARNTVLIHMQNPNATHVAGFSAWQKNFSRNVIKGEKGIRIFAPAPITRTKEMEKIDPDTQLPVLDENGNPVVEEVKTTIPTFKVVSVFDVSQTDGNPLPVLAENIEGNVAQYDLFRQALEQSTPYSVSYEPMADDTDGAANAETKHIRIREGMSEIQTVSALVHEMSHAELHSAENPEGETYEERAARRSREEVEAESISFVVCQHFGIETDANSFGYIANWSSDKELAELKASLDTIKKTASRMIDTIDARFSEIKQEHGIEQTVIEAKASTEQKPEKQYDLPDPAIGLSERDLYGYTSPDMLPLLKERALELYDEDHTIYLLNSDGTELMALSQTEIRQHPGIFGIEADEWQAALEYREVQAAVKDSEAAKETELLRGTGDRYGIYQIEDIRNTKYVYRPFDQAGADFNRTDYKLTYTAQLDPNTTLENLFTLHNRDNRPGGDKMRSMSMSDVVVVKRDGQISAHYVDTFGFQPVPQFLESHIKTAEMSTEQNYNMIDGIPNNTAPELVEIRSAAHSNYEGMTALIGANDNAVYLGRSENYDNNGHYDNSDYSLTFITHNPIVFPLLHGEGFIMSQDKMLKEGVFSVDTFEEYAALQAGVLAQFTPMREILFDGQPFKAPDHAPTVAELEADVKAGESISLLDLANAVKNERKTETHSKKPSVLGQLDRNKQELANKPRESNKSTRQKNTNDLEVD